MQPKYTYNKYKSFTAEELLQDDYFITSMTNPTKESDEFWQKVIEHEIISEDDYTQACYYISSLGVKSEPITQNEIFTLWEDIEVSNKYNLKKKKRKLFLYYSAASSIAAVLIILFFLFRYDYKEENIIAQPFSIEEIKAPDTQVKDIRLILANKETVSLTGKEAEIAYHENGIAIKNHHTELKKDPITTDPSQTYNQLIVPQGKRSLLTFAEGSKIWINAGSRVVYPVNFDKYKREIYVDGEVYLDITQNKNCPFIVKTKDFEIEVLGTSFNITAYEKDTIQSIVLVSGVVKINRDDTHEMVLSPNQMYTSSRNGIYGIKKVNVEDYTLWRKGLYQYESEPLGMILKRLSRYYGQEIVCSPQAAQLQCSGKLDMKDDLEIVLSGISKTAPIVYSFENERYSIRVK